MKAFTELFTALDETTKTKQKLIALVAYFSQAAPADAVWVLYFLSGWKLPQAAPFKRLKQ